MMTILIILCLFAAVTFVVIGVGSSFKGHFWFGWSCIVSGVGCALIPFFIIFEAARP